jgi:hypothetical protein
MKKAMLLALIVLSMTYWAFGQWTTPYNVSQTPSVSSRHPSVAFGPDGLVHMVWAELYSSSSADVKYVTYDGNAWSTPITLTDAANHFIEFPYVVVSKSGMVAVVWRSGDDTLLRVYDPKAKAWEPVSFVGNEGSNMPIVAVDSFDNIYVFYFNLMAGTTWSRSRINGVWEDPAMMSSGARATEGFIAAAPNDVIWVMWQEKGGDGNYKLLIETRDRNGWLMNGAEYINPVGATQALASMAFDPNTGTPYVAYLGEEPDAPPFEYYVLEFTINNQDNPRDLVIPLRLQHYPRIVVDANGVRHVATEDGSGDFGSGITYTNNENGGNWAPISIFPDSGGNPKVAGIAADAYDGNVAVCWDSWTRGTEYEAWVSFRYPVVTKFFKAPTNLSCKITATKLRTKPTVTYDLSWQKNPANTDSYLLGYRIFTKTGGGDWTVYKTTSVSELSARITMAATAQKTQIAICTVSRIGAESPKEIF